jgi:hypothetical protein
MKDGIEINHPDSSTTSIPDCLTKVIEYCRPFNEGGVAAYEAYDKFPVQNASTLSAFDILLANNIGANLSGENFVRLWRNREEIEKRLAKVPSDLDLPELSSDDEDLWENLRELFIACWCKGVSHSKITKILHKKRPQLIPIVDGEFVAKKYLGGNQLGAGEVPEYLVAATKCIQEVVARENNRTTLVAIREKLRQEKRIDLTLLRIFDILLYQHYSSQSTN